jgi:CDGSH-type Zn-finger protein
MNAPARHRQATITGYRDGPFLVRGDFRLVGEDGIEIDCARRTVALCRCGRSRLAPLCDGTHRLVGFRSPSAPGRADAGSGSPTAG